ncbi:hypothetical protein [Pontibacter litorisediminis]|uniref:hypothetical protein n=1 Tax=Pontibacter litorisediminis TaxID=1846260 RepID=UPI0023ECCF2D|nr:hypothetical protein [Pontibacter litorisediminis]
MSKQIIRLKEALELMENATEPFSIRYVACNKKKQTGGYWVSIDRCFVTGDQPKKRKATPAKASTSPPPTASRNPHHFENYTRNLKVVPEGHSKPSGQIRKCSIWLIKEVNGMEVII